jgi:thioesterase domain-containing protein
VRRYADEIMAAHHEKEVILCGFSIGGLMAFEIAKLLEAQHYSTKLILLDSAIENRSWLLGRSIFKSKLEKLNKDFEWARKQLTDFGFGPAQLERARMLWMKNAELSAAHKVKGKIDGDIIFFKARNNVSKDFRNLERWSTYTNGQFSYHYLSGHHYDMIKIPKNIKALVKEMLRLAGQL